MRFEIPGQPQGKARAKVTMTGGFARAYTPEKTANYENLIKLCYREQCGTQMVYDELHMDITAYFPIPKSAGKSQAERMRLGCIFPTKKPDADNIAKVVCDALNGIAYKDDNQIIFLTIQKKYSDIPKVVVEVWEHIPF